MHICIHECGPFRSQVKDVKLTADVITYSAAMSACNQADQWQSLGPQRMPPGVNHQR